MQRPAAPPASPHIETDPDLARLTAYKALVTDLPDFPAKLYLEAAVYKLRAVAYKEKRVQASATDQEALAVESQVEGDVLKLAKEAAEDCYKVLKYDLYNRETLLAKAAATTPDAAKVLANELIEMSKELRHTMLDQITATVSRVSLLSKQAQATTTTVVPVEDLPLHLAVQQVPESPHQELLAQAIALLTKAQDREGRVHVAQRKSILAGLQTEAGSHDVMDQARQAKQLAREAGAQARAVPMLRRDGGLKLVELLVERVVAEANEITHEYMASVRSSVGDIMKALRVAQEVAEEAEKKDASAEEQASEL